MDLADIVRLFKDQVESLSKLAASVGSITEPEAQVYIDMEELRKLAGVDKSHG